MIPDPRLARLVRHRPKPRDLSIGGEVERIRAAAERLGKRLGRVGDAWLALVPADLLEHTRIDGLRGGVLEISVDSTAARFALDRLLRGGLEARLRSETSPPIARVRVRVAADKAG
jgi:hypothetical protein